MDIRDALPSFIAEAGELLDAMEAALLDGAGGDFAIDGVFRAAHTIKGSAGLFGLNEIVAFTHVCESLLDAVRAGQLRSDAELASLLLRCGDHLRQLVAVAGDDTPPPAALVAEGEPLLQGLRARMSADGLAASTTLVGGPTLSDAAATAAPAATAPRWHLSLRFGPEVLRMGMDPAALLRYLGTMGTLQVVETVADALPELEALDAEACHLGFEIVLATAADKAQIDGAFDFVREDCTVRIMAPDSRVQDFVALIHDRPEDDERLGEILVRCGSVSARELQAALQLQAGSAPHQPLGDILVRQDAVSPLVVDAALHKQAEVRRERAQESRSVRVDADKLDRLIDLVGELITAAAGVQSAVRRTSDLEAIESSSSLAGLVEEVRDSALGLRMVKIGATFSRYQRVVHDVSRELGKDIRLELSGEDTELDKTVVERIGDPLMHLVRNAMDHGIEPTERRLAAGKPAHGTLRLNAYHDAGSIVIEVSDDGGGLDRERILAKAVERGLVEAGQAMSDSEVYALIFEPGFSTAEQVTNLSGRGVGMDVVRSNITALRGDIALRSERGRGTTVEIRLPLTLAIIHGFQVAVGDSVFVIPLEMVEECIHFAPDAGREVINLRGAALPFARLADVFRIAGGASARQSIVVVRHLGRRAGLVVDTLLGESQTVIKPLGRVFREVDGLAGSSVLGNGDVALILDVPSLLQRLQTGAFVPAVAEAPA